MGIKYIYIRLMADWKANLWLAIELLVVSVILWVIVDLLYVRINHVSEDTGFDISNTFLVRIGKVSPRAPEYRGEEDNDSSICYDRQEIVNRLRHRPEVECVGISINAYPYDPNNNTTNVNYISGTGDTIRNAISWIPIRIVTPDFLKVFRYRGAHGETPEELAEMLEKEPDGVILSSGIFGEKIDTDTFIGKEVEVYYNYLSDYAPRKVIGICKPVKYNEYQSLKNSASVISLFGSEHVYLLQQAEFTVRVKDGMAKDFIDNLMADSPTQFRIGNQFISDVQSFESIARNSTRESRKDTRNRLVVMVFLLVNIFLGLLGTFWFRTRQRVSEIALMKVVGATSRSVFVTQIGEGLLLLLLVTPLAALIDINMAAMELNARGDFGFLEWPRLWACVGIVFVIMTVMIVCGVAIPARKGMLVDPAAALHDE